MVARLLALGALLVASVSGQAQEVIAPAQSVEPTQKLPAFPKAETREITLSQAVELTLRHNPQILTAEQNVGSSLGRVQEAGGVFDGVVRVSGGFTYDISGLPPFLRQREEDKREQLRITADTFRQVNNDLGDILSGISSTPPVCPPELEGLQIVGFVDPVIVDRPDPQLGPVQGVDQDLAGGPDLGFGSFSLEDICRPSATIGLTRNDFVEYWSDVTSAINNARLDNVIDNFTQFPRESTALAYEITEAVATRAALGLERLGGVPIDETNKSLFIDMSYFRPLRNGMDLSGKFRLNSQERNFYGKLLDPTFGGFDFQTPFKSGVSLDLAFPLLKGRGSISRQAPERAAQHTLSAQQDLLRHVMSAEVFRTILAYISVMAARDALVYLEESAERQRQILSITQRLVDEGDLPRVEVDRAQARAATVLSALNDGQLSLLVARLSLAQTIGISVEQLGEAPLARDGFPEQVPASEPTANSVEAAAAGRRDLSAAMSLRESARVLADAARWDLKYRLDLTATFGYGPLYFSPFFRVLPDEQDPIESYQGPPPERLPPVHFYSPTGFYRGLVSDAQWKPFFNVGVTFDLPFGNNVANGRALQSESSFRRTDIERADLDRVIEANVVEVARAVRFAADALERRRTAADLYEQTLAGTQLLYDAGDITLIDTLVTEEDLTRALLALTADLQAFYSLYARLQFETAGLVRFESEGSGSERVIFDPSVWVAR